MKKIISAFAIVTMLVSSLVTTSFAEVSKENPVLLTGDVVQITEENNDGSYRLISGYDLYALKVSVKNSPLNVTYDDFFGGYTGDTLTLITAKFNIESDGVYKTDYRFLKKDVGLIDSGDGTVGLIENKTEPLASVVGKNFVAGGTAQIGELLVYVKPELTVTLTWADNQEVGTQTFNDSTSPNLDSYKGYVLGDLLAIDSACADGFVFGAVEEEKTAPEVAIETDAKEGPSGKWATGILGTVNFDPTKNTPFSTIEITPNNGTVDANPVEFTVANGSIFESAVTVKCALNITKCPDEDAARAIKATGKVK